MINRSIVYSTILSLIIAVGCMNQTEPTAIEQDTEVGTNAVENLKIENLLRETLELSEDIEVIVSYVEVPKATTLPYHYHPGEEFAFLLEGSGELILKDKSKTIIKAGEAGKVPLKHVHSFSTTKESAKMVVFRVHEKGQPDRILVEEK
jgi:quercetin dioxygenase-like cupin family protein